MPQTGTNDVNDATVKMRPLALCNIEFDRTNIIGRSQEEIENFILNKIAPMILDVCKDIASIDPKPRTMPYGSHPSWEAGCEKTSAEGKCSIKVGGNL